MTVREYISNSWEKSLRKKGHRADGIPLPYPYNSPCAEGIFDEFYYWDTCFINKGLIADKKIEAALRNALDMAFLIQKYGYMPNAAVTGMLNRTQPPVFGIMVCDLLPYIDGENAAILLSAMEREYDYWMKERVLPCGLNHYGNSADAQTKIFMADEAEVRLKRKFENADREAIGNNILAECESGWDFSPRFDFRCSEFAAVDLNSLLYRYETTLAMYGEKTKRAGYIAASERRKETMYRFCFDGQKLTDAVPGGQFGCVTSVADMLPFWAGISNDKDVLLRILKKLEYPYGIAACEKTDENFAGQWGYPNMWAPLVWFAFYALKAVGAPEEAGRIGKKYLFTVEDCFANTGKLWEKYDAVNGGKATANEYTETEMLGWTAGVYNDIYEKFNQ